MPATAPAPADAAKLTLAQLRGLLKKARAQPQHRHRSRPAARAFGAAQTRQLLFMEQVIGRRDLAALRQVDAACANSVTHRQVKTGGRNTRPSVRPPGGRTGNLDQATGQAILYLSRSCTDSRVSTAATVLVCC